PETEPDRQVVTAACSPAPTQAPDAGPPPAPAPTPAQEGRPVPGDALRPPGAPRPASSPWVDFAHLRAQLPLERVLAHLGLSARLRGRGPQRRGPGPAHAEGQGRTFSVHLDKQVFGCFDPACGIKGDVIDLWAAVKQLPLREAALELLRTFGLEPAPAAAGTEKRHGQGTVRRHRQHAPTGGTLARKTVRHHRRRPLTSIVTSVAGGRRGVGLEPAADGEDGPLQLGRDALGEMVVGPGPVVEAFGPGL